MSELMTFEWRRAKSIRTTWITSLFTIAGVALFSLLAVLASSIDGGEPFGLPLTDALETAVIGNPVTIVLISSLAAMAFGHEYRYGTIRLTLTAFPRRAGVFFAKLFTTLVIVLVVLALATLVGYPILSLSASATPGELSWLSLAWHIAVFGVTFALLAFTLTVITRSHPLGIVGPLLIFMLELIMLPLIAQRFDWLPKLFPLTAMTNWFAAGDDSLLGLGVWAGWMAGLLFVSYVLLRRRDA